MNIERNQNGDRIIWIDNAKFLGIFFVILGHYEIDQNLRQYIYSFHMPLFFFISGYLYSKNKYMNFKKFISRKIRTLLIPYFLFAFCSYFFWLIIVRKLSFRGASLLISPWKPFVGIFYSIGTGEWRIPLNIALWFVTCLFVCEIAFWFISKYAKDSKQLISILIIIGIIGYLDSIFVNIKMPWSADVAMTAIVFYGTGYLMKRAKADMVITELSDAKLSVLLIVIFCASIMTCYLNSPIDMNNNSYGNILLFYISAFAGIIFYLGISKIIKPNRLIRYIGKNTIVLIGLGGIVMFVLNGIIYLLIGRLTSRFLISIPQAILFSTIEIILTIPFIYGINRFFPYLLGRTRSR